MEQQRKDREEQLKAHEEREAQAEARLTQLQERDAQAEARLTQLQEHLEEVERENRLLWRKMGKTPMTEEETERRTEIAESEPVRVNATRVGNPTRVEAEPERSVPLNGEENSKSIRRATELYTPRENDSVSAAPTEKTTRVRTVAEKQALEAIKRLHSSPFTEEILSAEVPKRFTPPKFKQYDGKGDPIDHLGYYKQTMALNSNNDALMCRIFPSSLAPVAMNWFYSLRSGSIDTFESLCTTFVAHYISSCKVKKDVDALFNIVKGRDSLRLYVTKFKSEMLLVENCDERTAMVAFRKGMSTADPLYLAFARTPPNDMAELFARAEKYSRQEDEINRKVPRTREPERVRKYEERPFSDFPSKRFTRPEVYEVREYPFNLPLQQLFHKIKNEPYVVKPPPIRTELHRRDGSQRCDYHNDVGHRTGECRVLKNHLLELVRKGYLKQFLAPNRNLGNHNHPAQNNYRNSSQSQERIGDPSQKQNDRPRPNGKGIATAEGDDAPTPLTILTIHGGSSGDYPTKSSLRQMVKSAVHKMEINSVNMGAEASGVQRSKTNSLEFTDEDLIPVCLPHNDALIITVKISNFNVCRAYVDGGSATEVLNLDAFERMGIDKRELGEAKNPLVGFNNSTSFAIGKVTLVVTTGPISIPISFMVMDTPSPYNVILGRTWLHKLKAIPSTYHQLIKFPTPNGVMQIRGNQASARQCYAIAIKEAKQETKSERKIKDLVGTSKNQ